ncbi:hypothetical protein AAFF_G00182910, partial [Aldrovandia affinis]
GRVSTVLNRSSNRRHCLLPHGHFVACSFPEGALCLLPATARSHTVQNQTLAHDFSQLGPAGSIMNGPSSLQGTKHSTLSTSVFERT